MAKDINESLNRFNELMGYSPDKGIITERKKRVSYQDYAEDDEGNEDFDFGDEGSPEEGGEENADFDFGDEGSPEEGEFDFGGEEEGGEEVEDEFGTADEFSAVDELEDVEGDVEEIDVTAIVDKSDEAKEAAEMAVSTAQQNAEYLKSMTDTISNLTTQLDKMDTILNRVSKLEKDIKTPEEKLELRSLDSYPFNVKLTSYWEDKAETNDNYKISGVDEPKEYTISKEDIDEYDESSIQNSFNPESDDEITIYKRRQQY